MTRIARIAGLATLCLGTAVMGQTPLQFNDPCRNVLDLAFLVDASGSVPADGWEASRNFIKNFTQALTLGPSQVQVAIVTFSESASVILTFDEGQNQTIVDDRATNMPQTFFRTFTNLGLDAVRDTVYTGNGVRSYPEIPRLLVVITDGQSTDPDATPIAAAALRAAPYFVEIHAVGVGDLINTTELELIAGDPSDVSTVDSFDGLTDALTEITSSACTTTTAAPITASPTAAPTAGPTDKPSAAPTHKPSASPTDHPSAAPTHAPTEGPTAAPTHGPTHKPTTNPTAAPTRGPTDSPTAAPTHGPTMNPTAAPTNEPTHTPSAAPTHGPTLKPTVGPSHQPSAAPTHMPSVAPTAAPTRAPVTPSPTAHPTAEPTAAPVDPNIAQQESPAPSHAPTHAPTTECSVSVQTFTIFEESNCDAAIPGLEADYDDCFAQGGRGAAASADVDLAAFEEAFEKLWEYYSGLFVGTPYGLKHVLMSSDADGEWIVPPDGPAARSHSMVLVYNPNGPLNHTDLVAAAAHLEGAPLTMKYCGCQSSITIDDTDFDYQEAATTTTAASNTGKTMGGTYKNCVYEYNEPKNFISDVDPTGPPQQPDNTASTGKKGKKGKKGSSKKGKKGKKGSSSKKGKKGIGKLGSGSLGPANTGAAAAAFVGVGVVGAALFATMRRRQALKEGYKNLEALDDMLDEQSALLA
eukprot:m.436003 g.436003  ORF g.436003 m.436003 type:complete len:694 (+) comp17926_c0_seq1:100-2181(+)